MNELKELLETREELEELEEKLEKKRFRRWRLSRKLERVQRKIDTYVLFHGEGRPIVILHGLSGSAQATKEILAPHLRGYRIVMLNLPGHGGRKPISQEQRNPNDLADWVIAVLDVLGIERFALVGISFGGRVALHVTAKVPDRTTLLVLQGAPIRKGDAPWLHRGLLLTLYGISMLIRKMFGEAIASYPIRGVMWLIDTFATVHEPVASADKELRRKRRELNAWNRRMTHKPSKLDYIASMFLHDAEDIARSLPETLRVLLVDGEGPHYQFTNTSETLAELIPGAEEAVLVAGVGHELPYVKAEEFAEVILAFLSRKDYE